jgi:hypothetical protein
MALLFLAEGSVDFIFQTVSSRLRMGNSEKQRSFIDSVLQNIPETNVWRFAAGFKTFQKQVSCAPTCLTASCVGAVFTHLNKVTGNCTVFELFLCKPFVHSGLRNPNYQ